MLDIDRFKAINDGFGHAAGDRVLKEVAARMAASCRAGDLLGRLGGEEFLAVFADVAAAEAQAIAERLREAVERRPISLGGERQRAGDDQRRARRRSAPRPAPAGLSPAMERADAALYRAKAEGRNRILRRLSRPLRRRRRPRAPRRRLLLVLGEVLGEHRRELRRLRVVGGGIGPGRARVEQRRIDAGHLHRHLEAEVRVAAEPRAGELPPSAAVSSARVAAIGIRRPVP